jgi:hypothetical protein
MVAQTVAQIIIHIKNKILHLHMLIGILYNNSCKTNFFSFFKYTFIKLLLFLQT